MHKKDWLQHQIETAQQDLKNWPDWMKKSGRFEGSDRYRRDKVASTDAIQQTQDRDVKRKRKLEETLTIPSIRGTRPMTKRETIYAAIEEERAYQDEKRGSEFDSKNTLNDWKSYIVTYLGKVGEFKQSEADARHRLLQVAALAVAALEQTEFAKRHYD